MVVVGAAQSWGIFFRGGGKSVQNCEKHENCARPQPSRWCRSVRGGAWRVGAWRVVAWRGGLVGDLTVDVPSCDLPAVPCRAVGAAWALRRFHLSQYSRPTKCVAADGTDGALSPRRRASPDPLIAA